MKLMLDEVHTYYGESHILQGVSFKIAEGSVTALLGRNGMGKTTTTRSIVGFTPPRRGRIFYRGEDLVGMEPHKIVQMGIGLVPQGRRIFPSLTVGENLLIAARTHAGLLEVWDSERVLQLFPQLKSRVHALGSAISGGELQMLAIGRALMGNPHLLIMDEPSEGLAPLLVKEIEKIVERLKKQAGFSMLLVEQNLHLALAVSDYAYIMSKGKIVFESGPHDLRNNEEVKVKHLGV